MNEAMTRQRFFDLLAHHNAAYHRNPHMGNNGKGPPQWKLMGGEDIRAGVDAACPVTYLYDKLSDSDADRYGIDDWLDAAREMNLPSDVARQIVHAADKRKGHDAELRQALLRVCYLKEAA